MLITKPVLKSVKKQHAKPTKFKPIGNLYQDLGCNRVVFQKPGTWLDLVTDLVQDLKQLGIDYEASSHAEVMTIAQQHGCRMLDKLAKFSTTA